MLRRTRLTAAAAMRLRRWRLDSAQTAFNACPPAWRASYALALSTGRGCGEPGRATRCRRLRLTTYAEAQRLRIRRRCGAGLSRPMPKNTPGMAGGQPQQAIDDDVCRRM